MSLTKLAFGLALVVLLLPTDAAQQARMSNFANTTVDRLTTFCDRNGRTCAAGSEAWATFLRKAEFGVRLVGDLLGAGGRQTPYGQAPQGPYPQGPYVAPPPPYPPYRPTSKRDPRAPEPRGALAPPDPYYPPYQPPWRGPRPPSYGWSDGWNGY
jgi:hypothetical protein